jgi:hypothetical protein
MPIESPYYFPVRTFSTVEGRGSELSYEYGDYLATAGEPSLSFDYNLAVGYDIS